MIPLGAYTMSTDSRDDHGVAALGRAKGGIARAKALTPEQRREGARKAAAARWGEKPLAATHKGSFKEQLGVDVECYVLNDSSKMPVISQTGMARVLGMSARGSAFPSFINSRAMAPYIGEELREKLQKVVIFQWGKPSGGEQVGAPIHGHDAALLIDVCNAILAASAAGALKGARYENIVRSASILNGAAAKSGIRGLVYALAGYSPSAEEVIQAFKLYVRDEAKKYEQEFPPELYMAWHRLYRIAVPVRGKPWAFAHLTRRHIYYPLAKSNGKILDLLRALRDRDPSKRKLFQFLSDIGTRALRMHMGRVVEMAESSETKEQYEAWIAKRFGDQQELDLAGAEAAAR